MGSKALASTALLVSLNLLFFSLVSSTYCPSCTCPSTLNLDVCVKLLGLLNLEVGHPDTNPCCKLIEGVADLEVALCLCSTLKLELPILGPLLGPLTGPLTGLTIPTSLELLFNTCGRKAPCNYY